MSFYSVCDAPEKVDWTRIKNAVRAVRAVSRFVPGASCLTQAVAALLLIKAGGQQTELKIGVTKDNREFKAHAWLEIGGQIIIGKLPGHRQYIVLNSASEKFL